MNDDDNERTNNTEALQKMRLIQTKREVIAMTMIQLKKYADSHNLEYDDKKTTKMELTKLIFDKLDGINQRDTSLNELPPRVERVLDIDNPKVPNTIFDWNGNIDRITIDELKRALKDIFNFTDISSLPWKGKRKQPLIDKLNELRQIRISGAPPADTGK
jgi:hypothetical protein